MAFHEKQNKDVKQKILKIPPKKLPLNIENRKKYSL